MGKSPGKWLKTLLFRKKSSRSNSEKPGANLVTNEKKKVSSGKEPLSELGVNSPLVSQTNPVKNDPKGSDIASENRTTAEASLEVDSHMSIDQELEKFQTASGVGISQDLGHFREEHAAIKVQAFFRGCLARRAFQALKGIIRLQALVRGHLVRRQAVATLLCLQSIIKLQAAFRGRRVRRSDLGATLHHKMGGEKTKETKSFDAVVGRPSVRMEKLLANAFVKKVLVSSSMVKPLQVYYGPTEPNSIWCWLERWTVVYLIIPSAQQKNALDSHVQKHSNPHATSNEANRPKRSIRARSTGQNDTLANGNGHEPEKANKNMKKLTSPPPVDVGQEPQSELEKVKRNLRKVTANAAMIDTALDHQEMESDKLKHNMRKPPSLPTDTLDNSELDSDNNNKATPVAPIELPEPKKESLPVSPTGLGEYQQADSQAKQPTLELNPIEVPAAVIPAVVDAKNGNLRAVNGDLSSHSKDDQVCQPAQKTNKRRSSFPENGLNSPTVPSYMAGTESAKAKLRCQGSPRFASDVVEGDAMTRRHSLPSVSNGKVSAPSPRTQRLIQSNGKGGIRDRSLLSSRDGIEKAEWKR